MAIELVEISKNTRGVNTREIRYKAIGKWVEKPVQRDTRPAFNDDGTVKLDEKGNEVRLPLEKDANGKNIYVTEIAKEFVTEGVLTDSADALELVNYDEQVMLDCFAEGFNARAYEIEAGKDELDEFIKDMELDEDQRSTFKRTARQLSRGTGAELLDAAELIKTMMLQNKLKAVAAEPVSA